MLELNTHLSLNSTFSGVSKQCQKYSVHGAGNNLYFIESLIFLLSAINPGLAMITVSVDVDPLFLVGKMFLIESFLSSILLVSLRLFLLTLWLSEITRTLSMSIISFIITSNYLETYFKVVLLQGHHDTDKNKIIRNSYSSRVFENEGYFTYLCYKSVLKDIFVTFFVSLSGLAAIVNNNYLNLTKRIVKSNIIRQSFYVFLCIFLTVLMVGCSCITSIHYIQSVSKYRNKLICNHYACTRCFNQRFTKSTITRLILMERIEVQFSNKSITKMYCYSFSISCKLIFINQIMQTLVIK